MDEPLAESESAELRPGLLLCPECGQAVDAPLIAGPVAECSNCGTQFFPPEPEVVEQLSDDDKQKEQAKASLEEELSALRIRQLSTLMRANFRTRSYFIVGTIGCLWVIGPLLTMAWKEARANHAFGLWPTAWVLFALAALLGAIKFASRAVDIQREINASRRARQQEEDEAASREPDLSQLSDGSQHARNLERMVEAKSPSAAIDDGAELSETPKHEQAASAGEAHAGGSGENLS